MHINKTPSIIYGCYLLIMVTTTQASIFSESSIPLSQETNKQTSLLTVEPAPLGISQQCISCHDGNKAQSITIKSADSPLHFTGHKNTNHPVGMIYRNHAEQQPTSYIQESRLNKNIQLENGNVTCVSCHQVSNEQSISSTQHNKIEQGCISNNKLSVDKNLCMSCHII